MPKVIVRLLPLLFLFHFYPGSADAQQPNGPPGLSLGDAVVTGFSGTIAPDPTKPPPAGKSAADLTFINPDGPSARIMDVRQATATWDGSVLPATKPFDVHAKDVGQVFGIALDNQAAPNIYLAATSAFGLQIVGRGSDGLPERRKVGGPGEGWMKGQFGVDLGGDPGAIFKVDGTTGAVSLFANVALNGVPNPGAALGSLSFDAQHQQLFVSDRYTGMIHRFDLNGNDLGHYDHGVTGRTAAQLAPVPFDPSARPNIALPKFDTLNPDTWGFAPAPRRIFGLAVNVGLNGERLFYAVADGPQIWSVGIQQDGSFASDPRWELDVPAQPGSYEVSDILFSQQGAMILAQRAQIKAIYDYSAFTLPGEPHVLRFWLNGPNDPPSPGSWKPVPEEYAIGFAGDYRNTNGGVALGYDYGPDGALNTNSCEATLWTTGQDLRDDPALQTQLLPGGPLVVHGLFVVPANLVRPSNQPPLTSYSVDYDSAFHDPAATGHLGQVRIFTTPCAAGQNGGPVVSRGAPAGGGGNGGGVTPGGGNCQYGINPDGSCAPPYDLAIVKTGVISTTNGNITFTLAVTNPGAAINNAAVIQVADVVPAGMKFTGVTGANWSCTPTGTIPAGGVLICTYTGPVPIAAGASLPPIAITATAAAAGSYQNCASVGFAAGSGLSDSNPANNRSCATVAVPNYDLAIVKTGVASATASGGFTFTLAVTNPGAAISNAAAIQVTDTAPAGMTFTAVTAGPNWKCAITAGVTLTCAYIGSGPIASAAVLSTITVTATAPLGGSFKNCATVGFTAASDLSDSNPSNNTSCATVTNAIDLAIVKGGAPITSDTGPTSSGVVTGLEFDLTVTNIGLGFTGANNVTVTDVVPAGMTYTFLSATPATSWSCPTTSVTAGNSFTCTYIGAGPVGPSAAMGTIAISATPPPPQGQTVTNCASVGVTAASGLVDSNPSNNNACITLNSQGSVPLPTPPAFPTTCGFNVIFVLDYSGSMGGIPPPPPGGSSEVPAVQAILATAASIFNQNNSEAAEILFSDTAKLIRPMATSTYINLPGTYTSPFGQTNWEAGLMLAANTSWPKKPTIAIFITDGVPNEYLDASGNLVSTNNTALAASYAAPYVTQLYNAGIPVIGIGLTGAASQPVTLASLQVLLGPNADVTTTPYANLTTVFSGIADKLCPGLYLSKSISPNYFNYYGLTAAPQANITLKLTNLNAGPALPTVVVHDDLPPQLTLAGAPPPSFTGPPPSSSQTALAGPTLPGSGGEEVWTINTLPAAASPSVTFPVTLPAPGSKYAPTAGNCVVYNNYAQVTAAPAGSDGVATPNNMPSPILGPNHEVDEATAPLYLCNYQPSPQQYCSKAELLVTKVYKGPEKCDPGAACGPFTVTVTSQCTATTTSAAAAINGFVGPVEFGEGVYSVANQTSPPSKGTLVTASGLSFSSSITGLGSMSSCATNSSWTPATSTASACPANVNLPFGSTITFSPVTINAPTSTSYPATFLNCFIADGTTTKPPSTYSGAYTDVNSVDNPLATLGATPQPWGNCAPFEVAPTDRAQRCTPPKVPGPTPSVCVCPVGMVPVPASGGGVVVEAAPSSCGCPQGMHLEDNKCVPIRKQCTPPEILNADGICTCPPPLTMNPATGQCSCPEGSLLRGNECVRPIVCKPPQVLNAAGTGCVCPPPLVMNPATHLCGCPEGSVLRGNECVRTIVCIPPQVLNAAGTGCVCPPPLVMNRATGQCGCPEGTVLQGKECVRQINCPRGTVLRGQQCVPSGPGGSPGRGGAAPGGGDGVRRQ